MSVEQKIVDLLYYIREAFPAPRTHRHDRYLNPFTRRIQVRSRMQKHQLAHALWIPTVRGLKRALPGLRMEMCRGTVIVSVPGYLGAGCGESEALLSLVNDIRRAA